MDFTTLQNNPLYGPLRLVLASMLTYAAGKGWIPAQFVDPAFVAAAGTVMLALWSFYESRSKAAKADLVTAVAVNQAVVSQAPTVTPLAAAEQKAIIAASKAVVQGKAATEVTAALNESQLTKE